VKQCLIKQKKTNPDASEPIDPKILDRIKHPPAIDDVMRDLPPDELMGNPARCLKCSMKEMV
jgi:hypothetical protein